MERGVLAERKMCALFIVVGRVTRQEFAQVRFPEHRDMVEAFASDRSDQPFSMTILPGRAWCNWSVANARGTQPACDRSTVGSITVSDEVAWRIIPRECIGDL